MELGKSGKREHLIYYDNVAERDREILEGELGRKLVPYELSFTIGTDASRGFANFTPLSLSLYEIFKLLDGFVHTSGFPVHQAEVVPGHDIVRLLLHDLLKLGDDDCQISHLLLLFLYFRHKKNLC